MNTNKHHRLDYCAAKKVVMAFSNKKAASVINGRYNTDGKILYLGIIPVARWNDDGTLAIKSGTNNTNIEYMLREYVNMVLRVFYPVKNPPRLVKRCREIWMLFADKAEACTHRGYEWFTFTDKEEFFIPEFC